MNIWLVNPFDNLPSEGCRAQRYWLMARAFVEAGHHVVYWTSDFSHATKRKRAVKAGGEGEERNIRLVLIPTSPYKSNLSVSRVLSHRKLAIDFERLARQEAVGSKPDVVIASTPPLGLCDAARRIAAECGALFIADIQDAWPETFERILPRFVWSLLGLRRTAKRIYQGADGVSGVARRYVELATAYASDAPMHLAGHAIRMDDPGRPSSVHSPLRLVYVGNMSLSYDLATVITAVRALDGVTLDIAGNGPDRERLEKLGATNRVRFHGYLDEERLERLLSDCDVGIVPMFPESCVGVPGKLADYAKAGLRVIESLGGECREIVERYGAGCHYGVGDVDSLKSAIQSMRSATPMSEDCFKAFREFFDAKKVMTGYVSWVEGLLRCRADWGSTRGPHHDSTRE